MRFQRARFAGRCGMLRDFFRHRCLRPVALVTGAVFLMSLCIVFESLAAVNGLWYYDDYHVADWHARGFDGSGVRIADIDTMFNPQVPWLSDAKITTTEKTITKFYGDISPMTTNFDIAYHATDMLSVLAGNGQGASVGMAPRGVAPGASIKVYPAVTSEDDAVTGGDIYDEAMRLVLIDGADIVSIPAGGKSDFDRQYPYFLEAVRRGIPVFVAHANALQRLNGKTNAAARTDRNGAPLADTALRTADIDEEIAYWPGLVTVQSLDSAYRLQSQSRLSDAGVDIAAPGEDIYMEFYRWGHFEPYGGGCSTATVLAAGYLALAKQKYPTATGNQLLQLLIRTTAGQRESTPQTHPALLRKDTYTGFGVVHLDNLLNGDPLQYPDINPVLYTDIARYVENARARDDYRALTDRRLTEIADVLYAQVTAAGYQVPEFLEAVCHMEEAAALAAVCTRMSGVAAGGH